MLIQDVYKRQEEKKKLVDVTKECIEIGLKHVKPWALLGDMGHEMCIRDRSVRL